MLECESRILFTLDPCQMPHPTLTMSAVLAVSPTTPFADLCNVNEGPG